MTAKKASVKEKNSNNISASKKESVKKEKDLSWNLNISDLNLEPLLHENDQLPSLHQLSKTSRR